MPSQRGAALLVSLVILLVMTVLGVTASRTTMLQERMAGNMRDKAIAFQGAEATLRTAEEWIQAQVGNQRPTPVSKSACSAPPCEVYKNDTFTDPKKEQTWAGTNAQYMRDGPDLNKTSSRPQYYIEQQKFVPDSLNQGGGKTTGRIYYRVGARSPGKTDKAVSVLTSTFAARF